MRRTTRRPLVVMGDMNCGYGARSVRLLAERLELTAWRATERSSRHEQLATWSSTLPLVRFDWILVSRELSIVSHETRPERVSDHAAVVAELALS